MESKKFKRLTRRLIQSDPNYAAMIENLDENIGKLLNVLEETGKSENTVVFFTSDNGGLSTAESCPTTNKPLHEGKGWMYEGGVREPLIIRWPKVIKRGSICEIPITSPDFYPTILEIANLSLNPSQHCDGVSFLSVLKGNPNLERGPIFWHYPHYGNQGGTPGSIIRNGDFKLIEFFEDHHIELYNLKEDIGEKYNIASDNPEIVAKLKKELEIWRKSTEAKYPEPNPNYNPEPKDFREKLRLLYWNLVYKLEIFKNNHKTTLKD